ncbi:hypothetical protein SAMN05421771_0960 [Granulicella pectinivorans]|jgi:hypothetical protein|uniref:Uncharacterized protein n=1 Tax=Granulicella pectinivorans TaxID=474950 RepID=A0A1I6LM97_9BACT|nr:hypothetical protein [Granulicella pectinivorans]SFS04687.1 hypothetical protein SAMN05421771_0960 [Granulicella pectinivorans]
MKVTPEILDEMHRKHKEKVVAEGTTSRALSLLRDRAFEGA